MKKDECPLKGGSLVLQRPIWNLWWCWERGEWPVWWRTFYLLFEVLVTILYVPVLGFAGISHVLQYVDNGIFVHTSFGRMRSIHYKNLCPGLLDTAIILHPRDRDHQNAWSDSIKGVFLKLCDDRTPVNIRAFFMAPLVRFFPTRFSFEAMVNCAESVVNCAEAVAYGWMKGGGVNFHRELGVAPHVLFPTDFLRSNRFIRCETCLRVPVNLEPSLKEALNRWLDHTAPIPCTVVKPVTHPTFHIFGPFPPQFFHTARQHYIQTIETSTPTVRADEFTIRLTPTVCHDRSTHHLFLPASCDRLTELAKRLDQIIPSTEKQKQSTNRGPKNAVNIYTLSPSFSQQLSDLPQNHIFIEMKSKR